MTTVTHNLVVAEGFVNISNDGVAFYFDTHWTSIGEYGSCFMRCIEDDCLFVVH